tara:strand:+ start:4299 stop:6089 length:1791 start_codon:yes stop_codon:yes gene_type:complete
MKNKKKVAINYTNRDYESIRNDLTQIAERFYPDTFQDFSEGSFGAMMLDAVAYVGDQLSFYLDYNVNETFLDTAFQYGNVVRQGRILGYKNTGRPSTYGKVAIYVQIPASSTGLGPDTRYIPTLKRGTRFTSQNGLNFVLTNNVDFADPKNPVVVARTDTSTGAPSYYAIKAYGDVVSGFFGVEQVTCGDFQRFKRIRLGNENISEIVSVTDSDGNEYFEVDYLAQDMVYKELTNKNYKADNVPSILKPLLVSRKFQVVYEPEGVYLQFGSGDDGATDVVAEPQNVAMNIFGKTYVTDEAFDPSRLTNNKSFGIVPTNTTLTVAYRQTNPANSNVAAGGLNQVSSILIDFEDLTALANNQVSFIRNSFEVSNEEPIVGNVSNPTTAEVKQRIYDTFPTQNRAVTQKDYESLTYRMPLKFGSVKRCSVQKDPDSQKRNLNVYVISENTLGKLVETNSTIKKNLKVWLNNYRMINDTIDILDPFIINFGINFVVKPDSSANKFDVLDRCVERIANKYGTSMFIGERLSISEIFSELSKVNGVNDVVKVQIVNKNTADYSSVVFPIQENLSPDGDYLLTPANAILELKFPEVDIKGKLR